MTLEELTAQRDALLAARCRGLRTVEMDGRRMTYATDNEIAVATPIWSGGLRSPAVANLSLFLARALNAQCCLGTSLKPLGINLFSAPHTLAINPVLNSC